MILENNIFRHILCSILKFFSFITDLVSSLSEKKYFILFPPTRIRLYVICPPDKGKEIIIKLVSCESSENGVVEGEAGCGSERGVGCCSLLRDCNSSNMLSCHSSEGINIAVIIKLNYFPGKLNVRKSEPCRQSGQ